MPKKATYVGLMIFTVLLLPFTELGARQPPSGTRPVMEQAECVKRILEGELDKMAYEIMGINELGTLYGTIAKALVKRGAHYASANSDFYVSPHIELNSDRYSGISIPDDGKIYKLAVLELRFYCFSKAGLIPLDSKSSFRKGVIVKFEINMLHFIKDDFDKVLQNFLPLIDKALPKK